MATRSRSVYYFPMPGGYCPDGAPLGQRIALAFHAIKVFDKRLARWNRSAPYGLALPEAFRRAWYQRWAIGLFKPYPVVESANDIKQLVNAINSLNDMGGGRKARLIDESPHSFKIHEFSQAIPRNCFWSDVTTPTIPHLQDAHYLLEQQGTKRESPLGDRQFGIRSFLRECSVRQLTPYTMPSHYEWLKRLSYSDRTHTTRIGGPEHSEEDISAGRDLKMRGGGTRQAYPIPAFKDWPLSHVNLPRWRKAMLMCCRHAVRQLFPKGQANPIVLWPKVGFSGLVDVILAHIDPSALTETRPVPAVPPRTLVPHEKHQYSVPDATALGVDKSASKLALPPCIEGSRPEGMDSTRHPDLSRQPRHSDDFATVSCHHGHFVFSGTNQRSAMKVLWEEWEAGSTGDTGTAICAKAELKSQFTDVFKGHPAWDRLIVRCAKGIYRLDLPPYLVAAQDTEK